jgi:hypothetical protein
VKRFLSVIEKERTHPAFVRSTFAISEAAIANLMEQRNSSYYRSVAISVEDPQLDPQSRQTLRKDAGNRVPSLPCAHSRWIPLEGSCRAGQQAAWSPVGPRNAASVPFTRVSGQTRLRPQNPPRSSTKGCLARLARQLEFRSDFAIALPRGGRWQHPMATLENANVSRVSGYPIAYWMFAQVARRVRARNVAFYRFIAAIAVRFMVRFQMGCSYG